MAESWRTHDIVYLAVVTPVLLAAAFELLLLLAAFLYCLVKVFQKADRWSSQVLAVTMMVLILLFRGIFLPVLLFTIPFPRQVSRHWPPGLVTPVQWFALGAFTVLLAVPWSVCVARLIITTSSRRPEKIKQAFANHTAPKVVIVMPVYQEHPSELIKTIESVVNSEYPKCRIHLFVSYDGVSMDESYLQVIHHLGAPISLESYPQSIDVTYKGVKITVSRFVHGGKRHCQQQTFKLVDKMYFEYSQRHDDLFMLFIDSDCFLDKRCLQNFVYDMELKPGRKRKMLAMTGIITSTTEKNKLLTLLQDLEYIHGQFFERSVESGCGAVTCLPGALTILRFSAFRKMSKYYFADKAERCEDLFDYGKCYLGEDRWLTHLFMIGAKERYQIQLCTTAFCKTTAVQTFSALMKQRRRWFLGYITNEVCLLTDIRLWKRYPFLCLIRFMNDMMRTTTLLFLVQTISLILTSGRLHGLPVIIISVSLVLNYSLMFYLAIRLRRLKALLYLLMFILMPLFNWLFLVYGIFTSGQRTWGGPRADAAKADKYMTPEEAVERAMTQGDELNVVVDTFRHNTVKRKVPVHPSENLRGRFSASPRPGNYPVTIVDGTGIPLANAMTPLPSVPRIGVHPGGSSETVFTSDSESTSMSLPLPVEGTRVLPQSSIACHHTSSADETSLQTSGCRERPQLGHRSTHELSLSVVSTRELTDGTLRTLSTPQESGHPPTSSVATRLSRMVQWPRPGRRANRPTRTQMPRDPEHMV
ncbi:chitin synthase D [Aspergillus affinis]|uniref:chitin synthase D n=1 Tax=Aspergillus affinis TaxID=1070780 RepID=UPI0022FF0654|nr:uncharacterized protein KD926_010349 [Aspergillus affinis]KAI9045026.1 hypothetical protein KD926_010349 [Aspergillus affinis]